MSGSHFALILGIQRLLLAFFHEHLSFFSRMQSSCLETVLSFQEMLEGIVGETLITFMLEIILLHYEARSSWVVQPMLAGAVHDLS